MNQPVEPRQWRILRRLPGDANVVTKGGAGKVTKFRVAMASRESFGARGATMNLSNEHGFAGPVEPSVSTSRGVFASLGRLLVRPARDHGVFPRNESVAT